MDLDGNLQIHGVFPEDKVHLPSTEKDSWGCSAVPLLFISFIQHLDSKTLGTGFAKDTSFSSNLSCPLNLSKESILGMAGAALHPTALPGKLGSPIWLVMEILTGLTGVLLLRGCFEGEGLRIFFPLSGAERIFSI